MLGAALLDESAGLGFFTMMMRMMTDISDARCTSSADRILVSARYVRRMRCLEARWKDSVNGETRIHHQFSSNAVSSRSFALQQLLTGPLVFTVCARAEDSRNYYASKGLQPVLPSTVVRSMVCSFSLSRFSDARLETDVSQSC